MPSTFTWWAVIGVNSERVESSAARWKTVSTSYCDRMRSSSAVSRIDPVNSRGDQRRQAGVERVDVEGDDRAAAGLGEPGDQAVADLAAGAGDEDDGLAHRPSILAALELAELAPDATARDSRGVTATARSSSRGWWRAGSGRAWPADGREPPVVLLHEGLGSVSTWRDFPAALAAAHRPRRCSPTAGAAMAAPTRAAPAWRVDFMHREAERGRAARARRGGHRSRRARSGTATAARLRCWRRRAGPARVAALALEAPHVFVEDLSVASIAAIARALPADGESAASPGRAPRACRRGVLGLERRLAEPRLPRLEHRSRARRACTCPVLVLQGLDDEYGTAAQIAAIAAPVGGSGDGDLDPKMWTQPASRPTVRRARPRCPLFMAQSHG